MTNCGTATTTLALTANPSATHANEQSPAVAPANDERPSRPWRPKDWCDLKRRPCEKARDEPAQAVRRTHRPEVFFVVPPAVLIEVSAAKRASAAMRRLAGRPTTPAMGWLDSQQLLPRLGKLGKQGGAGGTMCCSRWSWHAPPKSTRPVDALHHMSRRRPAPCAKRTGTSQPSSQGSCSKCESLTIAAQHTHFPKLDISAGLLYLSGALSTQRRTITGIGCPGRSAFAYASRSQRGPALV